MDLQCPSEVLCADGKTALGYRVATDRKTVKSFCPHESIGPTAINNNKPTTNKQGLGGFSIGKCGFCVPLTDQKKKKACGVQLRKTPQRTPPNSRKEIDFKRSKGPRFELVSTIRSEITEVTLSTLLPHNPSRIDPSAKMGDDLPSLDRPQPSKHPNTQVSSPSSSPPLHPSTLMCVVVTAGPRFELISPIHSDFAEVTLSTLLPHNPTRVYPLAKMGDGDDPPNLDRPQPSKNPKISQF